MYDTYSNDTFNSPLPSCKKSRAFIIGAVFKKVPQNPDLQHLIPKLRFFPDITQHPNDTLHCLLPSCTKSETFYEQFLRKCPYTPILTP